MNSPWPDLLDALRGIPKLPGAACRGSHELFEDPERVDEAIEICETRCPALQACEDWSKTLRHNQIDGVIGAEHRVWISHPSLLRNKHKPI